MTLNPIRSEALIRLEQVAKAYAGQDAPLPAVRGVSLEIARGDIFGIIGKSGAGKSTLLRLINLLERPDSGRVIVDGRDLTALSKRALRTARQSLGMIFQQFNLLQNVTVFENVAFPLRVHRTLRGEALAARVRECLEIVGLADKSASYPAQLSGGQKQRVAIARALASQPAVLLCDEPTSALDTETTRAILDVLRDINRRLSVTVVIVTHELSVVRALCRHVAVMEDGSVVEQARIDGHQLALRSALGLALMREAANPYLETA